MFSNPSFIMNKTSYFLIFLVLLFTFSLSSCDQCDCLTTDGEDVHIFLLKQYETTSGAQIDESKVVLKDTPLISYSDIKSYNSTTYTFEFTENGRAIIGDMEHSVRGIPFAVAADDELIYTAYFWPAFSSLSCDWLTLDPSHVDFSGEGIVSAGYPGPHPSFNIPDNRNDPRILEIFKRDGKLNE